MLSLARDQADRARQVEGRSATRRPDCRNRWLASTKKIGPSIVEAQGVEVSNLQRGTVGAWDGRYYPR